MPRNVGKDFVLRLLPTELNVDFACFSQAVFVHSVSVSGELDDGILLIGSLAVSVFVDDKGCFCSGKCL